MRLGSRTNCGLTSVGRSVYYICCFRPLSSWTVFQRRSMCSSQPAIVQLPGRFSRTPLSVRYVSHVDFFVKYYYSLHSPVYGERAVCQVTSPPLTLQREAKQLRYTRLMLSRTNNAHALYSELMKRITVFYHDTMKPPEVYTTLQIA